MRILVTLLLQCTLLIAPVATHAAVPQQARALYFAGDYEKSSEIAAREGSSEALAFAAQSLIAEAITEPHGFCLSCLQRAEVMADRAIALDPNRAEGYVQKAIAIGFRGRAIGIAQARSEGLAGQAKAQLDAALALEPENIWAQASLGAWHLEIVHHAGPILAELGYGADRTTGLELYRKAISKGSEIAILHFHFALALLAMQESNATDEARTSLQNVLGNRSKDNLTRHARLNAKKLLDALVPGTSQNLTALVRKLQGYPHQ